MRTRTETNEKADPWALVNLNCDSLDVVSYCCYGDAEQDGFQPRPYLEPLKVLMHETRETLLHGYGVTFQLRRPHRGRRSALIEHCDWYAKKARKTLNCWWASNALENALYFSSCLWQLEQRGCTDIEWHGDHVTWRVGARGPVVTTCLWSPYPV